MKHIKLLIVSIGFLVFCFAQVATAADETKMQKTNFVFPADQSLVVALPNLSFELVAYSFIECNNVAKTIAVPRVLGNTDAGYVTKLKQPPISTKECVINNKNKLGILLFWVRLPIKKCRLNNTK